MEPKFTVRDLRGILLAELDVEGTGLASYIDIDKETGNRLRRELKPKRSDQTADEYVREYVETNAWKRSTDWYECTACSRDITLEDLGIGIKIIGDGSMNVGPFRFSISSPHTQSRMYAPRNFHDRCLDQVMSPTHTYAMRFPEVMEYVTSCFTNAAQMQPGLEFDEFWAQFKEEGRIDTPFGTTHKCFSCTEMIPHTRIPVLTESQDRPDGQIYYQEHTKNFARVTCVDHSEPIPEKPPDFVSPEIYLFHPFCFRKILTD